MTPEPTPILDRSRSFHLDKEEKPVKNSSEQSIDSEKLGTDPASGTRQSRSLNGGSDVLSSSPGINSAGRGKQESSRRAIFDRYWKHGLVSSDGVPQEVVGGDLQRRTRSRSQSFSSSDSQYSISYFAPPPALQKSLKKHHTLPSDIPDGDIPNSPSLLTLPPPLLRYVSDGSSSGGVYPLLSPSSILRKRHDEPPTDPGADHNEANRNAARDEHSTDKNDDPLESSEAMTPFRLDDRHDIKAKNAEFFSRKETDSSEERRKVQFDPRIVVTEFDDDLQRQWFSEAELNHSKNQAILSAQHYMLTHPTVAQEFNRSEIDPITGKERKKALFALPMFALSEDVSPESSVPGLGKLLQAQVKRILIVDPNEAILDLFCRSLKQIFPDADISTAQSSEVALEMYAASMDFDIVIVEERQCRRTSRTTVGVGGQALRTLSSSELSKLAEAKMRVRSKRTSMSNLQGLELSSDWGPVQHTMSGSQLLQKICELSRHAFGEAVGMEKEPTTTTSEPGALSETQRIPLLIGVSVNVENDGKRLRNSGADMIWGKPPPHMGEKLRTEILSAIVTKRQNCPLSVRIPKDSTNT